MKRKLCMILVFAMIVMTAGFITACGDQSGEGSEDESATIEEMESSEEATAPSEKSGGAVLVKTDTKDYYGTWTSDTPKAEHLYGELEFTINEDGTWEGDVNYEQLHGTWEETDLGIHLDDEVLGWGCDLNYTQNGRFVLTEDDLGTGGRIVLKKR